MKRPAEIYSRDEINALVFACSSRSYRGHQSATIIKVLWRCGLRIEELCSLKTSDVDIDGRNLIVLGKGGKIRNVPLDIITVEGLQAQLRRRRDLFGQRGYVFTTAKGTKLDQCNVRRMLKALAARAGITKRVHPHGFRHTLAVELATEDVPMAQVQRMLGHEHLSTTDIYLRRLSVGEDLKETIHARA